MPKSKKVTREPSQQLQPVRASEFLTKVEEEPEPPLMTALKLTGWPKPPGWPLTFDELARLSPKEAIQKAQEERRHPSKKLDEWLVNRMVAAHKQSQAESDPETGERLKREAFKEVMADYQAAYQAAKVWHLESENRALSKKQPVKANEERARRKANWQASVAREAEEVLNSPGCRQWNAAQLTMFLCKKVEEEKWDPQALYSYPSDTQCGTRTVTADRVQRYLAKRLTKRPRSYSPKPHR